MTGKGISFGKKMRKLIKYNLDRKKTLDYFQDNLKRLNALSIAVLENILFDLGDFYTLMPESLTEKQLHEFRGGCVKSYGIQEGVSKYVYDFYSSNTSYTYVFDEYDQTYEPDLKYEIFDNFGVHLQEEMYFVLQNKDIDTDNIEWCFERSDCIWHSLMVMTDTPFKRNEDRSISKEELQSIAKHAKLVVLRAYDQEGYVFWERSN